MLPKRTCFGFFMIQLFRKIQKVKSVFGLHIRVRIAYEPIPKSTQCTPKIEKKAACVKHTLFCIKNTKTCEKRRPKGTQMGDSILVVAPLGAPLAPQFVF